MRAQEPCDIDGFDGIQLAPGEPEAVGLKELEHLFFHGLNSFLHEDRVVDLDGVVSVSIVLRDLAVEEISMGSVVDGKLVDFCNGRLGLIFGSGRGNEMDFSFAQGEELLHERSVEFGKVVLMFVVVVVVVVVVGRIFLDRE